MEGVTIDVNSELLEKFVDASIGLTKLEIDNSFARALVSNRRIDASDLKIPLYTLYFQFMQENQFFNNLCYPYQLTVNKSFKKI